MPRSDRTTAARPRCPKCGSGHVHRSHRRVRKDGLLRALFCSAYRCYDCGHRHYQLSARALAASAALLLTVVFLAGIGWIVWNHYELGSPDDPQAQSTPAAQPSEPAAAAGDVRSAADTTQESLRQKAERGDALAQYLVGIAHATGQGLDKDLTLAAQWLEKAARQGHADAQYALGTLYFAGRGVLQDYETAFVWIEKAARQNHAEAQYKLATLYRNGDGVGADKVQAYVWFNLAAAQGHERAAEARDSLASALTPEQLTRGQRESQAWRKANPAR